MYLLTEWEDRMGKYTARGHDVWTERSDSQIFSRPARPNSVKKYIYFFLEGTVTNPAIWLVLYPVSIFLSLPTGQGNVSWIAEYIPNFVAIFHKYISFFRLGSIFKQTRRLLPQADK